MNTYLILDSVFLPAFWIFTFVFLTSVGLAFVPFNKESGNLSVNPFTWFWYGLGISVAFLQIWNIFFPVTFYCWLCLLPFALLGIKQFIRLDLWHTKKSISKILSIFCFLILIFLIISSLDNSFIYDTLVYHFYTIKWYNYYPVTRGMGNLFIYLGLNQTFFLFPSFLNSFWNNYKGACATNGLLAIVICLEILVNNTKYFLRKEKLTFHAIFQLLFLPLCINVGVQNLSSPTPDVFVNLLTYKVMSDIIGCLEKMNVKFQDIFLISFFCLMGVIMKMSFLGVALGVLPVIIWWLYSLKLLKQNLIFKSIIIFLVLVVPWAIRGVISSGYIAFPISFFGMPVDWKMPKEELVGFSAYIKGFARSHLHGPKGIEAAYNYSWFPDWVKRMLTTVGFILPVTMFFGTILILKLKKQKIAKLLFVLMPIFIAIFFWFFTAPDIRFAVFTFWSLGIISLAYFIFVIPIKWINYFPLFIFICSVLIMIRNWNTDPELLGDLPKQERSVFITKSGLKVNTIKNTPPGDDWQIGDCSFPCSVFPDSNLVLRRKEIKDGFGLSSNK